VKVGVGVNTDFPVIWNDLGSDMNNVVDCGLMAKLLFAEKYRDTSFTNLSLQQCVKDILRHTVGKESQKTNWKGDENGDITEEQKKCKRNCSRKSLARLTLFTTDAAIDAHASLRLYEALVPALA
jgi:hypothetical protein